MTKPHTKTCAGRSSRPSQPAVQLLVPYHTTARMILSRVARPWSRGLPEAIRQIGPSRAMVSTSTLLGAMDGFQWPHVHLPRQQHQRLLSLPTLPVNGPACIRQFSSNSKEERLLINERLVATIMKSSSRTEPGDVQVRMLMDTRDESISEIVSLKNAIQTAVREDRDLVEVALKQDIPVVRVASVVKVKQEKDKKKKQAAALAVKEVHFSTDIADNDLQRKTNQMISYLKKGHMTRIRIRAKRYRVAANANVLDEFISKVVEVAKNENAGEIVKRDINEHRTQAVILLQTPAKEKNS